MTERARTPNLEVLFDSSTERYIKNDPHPKEQGQFSRYSYLLKIRIDTISISHITLNVQYGT